MKLYQLTGKYAELQHYAENEEIDIEVLEDTLESITDEVGIKFENISKMIKVMQGDINLFKEEEKRIAVRRKAMENKVEWLKSYMLDALYTMKLDKVKAGTFTVVTQKNPASVNITDASKLPERFMIPQEPKLDKKAILETLKNGGKVDGASIAEETHHVRIR